MKDHSFLMTSKSNSKLFKMLTNMTNGKKWITQDNSIIHIRSKSDNYNIMKIIYKEENNYITFTIYESDLVFVVEKQI
ncbi:hypothetical protein ACYE2N_05145 [Flavobacterium sp. MAHUQ-51]|uniref:hypothetical protein n=1 Tax=Flavobacterium sp. GCM10022190 TaxID=3252639 RepID=UPI00360D1274